MFVGRRQHLVEPLGVGDDFGGVEGVPDGVNEGLPVPLDFAAGRAGQDLGGGHALLFERRQAAGEDGLGDRRDGDAEVEGALDGPLAGPLLGGPVQDAVHQEVARIVVLLGEDLGGDLDQERVQVPPRSTA